MEPDGFPPVPLPIPSPACCETVGCIGICQVSVDTLPHVGDLRGERGVRLRGHAILRQVWRQGAWLVCRVLLVMFSVNRARRLTK